MADTKITNLTELTALALADLIAVIDDPTGSPISKKATIQNLLNTITLLTAITSFDDKDDELAVYDSSATALKKITMANASVGVAFAETVTISSGNLAATSKHIICAAESGTEDTIDTMNVLSNYNEVYLYADTGDTIHINHNSGGTGDLLSPNGQEFELSENIPTCFIKIGGEWKWIAGPQIFNTIPLAVGAPADALALGDGQVRIENIDQAFVVKKTVATLETASTSGLPDIAIRDDGTDIHTTDITIDANETSSETAAAPPVIDSTKEVIAADSEIHIDIDAIGTGSAGLNAYLVGYWRDVNW